MTDTLTTTMHAASAAAVVAADPGDLKRLADLINACTAAAEDSAKAAVQHAIDAGRMLLAAKQRVPYGEFEKWISMYCTVAPRTARAYMRLADKFPALPDEERQRVAEMPLRQAVAAIATPAEGRAAPERGDYSKYFHPVFHSCASSMQSLSHDIRIKRITRDRIQKARAELLAATAELDKMLAAAEGSTE